VLVSFNPWWFSGQEHLARAFLGQLQAVLPAKYAGFKKLGDKLADFSGAIGGAADLIGAAVSVPVGGAVLEAGARLLGRKPKDVPGLKDSMSQLLLEKKKRVLVVIDDIDRLTPDEVRQLFTVIKALGDFPYITYLLAFDRGVGAMLFAEMPEDLPRRADGSPIMTCAIAAAEDQRSTDDEQWIWKMRPHIAQGLAQTNLA
jgi:predicted KAP-like P-loop ATPase